MNFRWLKGVEFQRPCFGFLLSAFLTPSILDSLSKYPKPVVLSSKTVERVLALFLEGIDIVDWDNIVL